MGSWVSICVFMSVCVSWGLGLVWWVGVGWGHGGPAGGGMSDLQGETILFNTGCFLPQVDLHAATSKARARSMQQIRRDKIQRAAEYHRSLARHSQLPRFLRMLSFRLRAGLVDMAASSVAAVMDALRPAAPGQAGSKAVDLSRGSSDTEAPATTRSSGGVAMSHQGSADPQFFCSVVLAEDGGIGFSPSKAEWTAAVKAEVITASLHLAGAIPGLLSLPAFERYDTLPADEECLQQGGSGAQGPLGAASLAQQHPVFAAAAAELQSLLADSFATARTLAQQYQGYHEIRRFGADFIFEEWAAKQRCGVARPGLSVWQLQRVVCQSCRCCPCFCLESQPTHADCSAALSDVCRDALDLPATDALLRRLRSWQQELDLMPLSGAAGLLHIDAVGLKGQLAPIVSAAQDAVAGLLVQLAGERCREVLSKLATWREVAAARPPVLGAFLPWRSQLGLIEVGSGQASSRRAGGNSEVAQTQLAAPARVTYVAASTISSCFFCLSSLMWCTHLPCPPCSLGWQSGWRRERRRTPLLRLWLSMHTSCPQQRQ